jgi:hypothetical protein
VLLDEHRGAFEYDWRTRFGLPLSALPVAMDWAEAWRLTLILVADPTSQVCAAMSAWKHPLSWEGIALRDLYDLQHQSKAKRKPKPYPRPWDVEPTKHGTGSQLTPEQFEALRARHREN